MVTNKKEISKLLIETINYTDFRAEIYKLLDEYDMYKEIPHSCPRIDLEDNIDNLLTLLTKPVEGEKHE
jgi:hypothetical protein